MSAPSRSDRPAINAVRLGSVIADRRRQAGLTQAALSEQVDCSPRHIQLLERGRTNASRELLQRLRRVLGADLNDLASPPVLPQDSRLGSDSRAR